MGKPFWVVGNTFLQAHNKNGRNSGVALSERAVVKRESDGVSVVSADHRFAQSLPGWLSGVRRIVLLLKEIEIRAERQVDIARICALPVVLLLVLGTVSFGARRPRSGTSEETPSGPDSSGSIEATLGPGPLLLVGSGLLVLGRVLRRVREP